MKALRNHLKTSVWWPFELFGILVTVGTWVLIVTELMS